MFYLFSNNCYFFLLVCRLSGSESIHGSSHYRVPNFVLHKILEPPRDVSMELLACHSRALAASVMVVVIKPMPYIFLVNWLWTNVREAKANHNVIQSSSVLSGVLKFLSVLRKTCVGKMYTVSKGPSKIVHKTRRGELKFLQ